MASGVLAFGQSKSATVMANGDVKVNGNPVRQEGHIFPGEKMKTGRDAKANLASPGMSAVVAPGSTLTWQGNSIDLECGGVVISTPKQFSTQAHDVTAVPTDTSDTKYEVVQDSHGVHVQSLQGKVNVTQGKSNTTLAEGKSLDLSNGSGCKEPIAAGWLRPTLYGVSTLPIYFLDSDNVSPFEP